jgi:hypothetical protein
MVKRTNNIQHVLLFLVLAHLVKLLSMVFALLVHLVSFAQVEAHLVTLQIRTQSCVELEKLLMQVQQLVFGMVQLFVQLERMLIHQHPIMQRIALLAQQIVLVKVDLPRLLPVRLANMLIVEQLLVLPQLAAIQVIMLLAQLVAILARLDRHVLVERQHLSLVAADKYPTLPNLHV